MDWQCEAMAVSWPKDQIRRVEIFMGCKASIGVVALVLSTSCSLAASVDRNDPKYANCTSARGFLNFASPSYPLRSSGLVYQANGR